MHHQIHSNKLSFLEKKPFQKFPKKPSMNNLTAMIVPHAGLKYSGPMANEGYARVDWSNYNRILILSTHHAKGTYIPLSTEYRLSGKLYKFNHEGLENIIPQNNSVFENEHSWLVQLPFLQKRDNLTVILVNQYTDAMFQSIFNIIEKDTLVIATTDLLHCGPDYDYRCPDNIQKFNQNTIRKIIDQNGFLFPRELCGKNVIEMFRKIVFMKQWDYYGHKYISSDLRFPSSNSVGYTTILYTSLPLKYLLQIPRLVMEADKVRSSLGRQITRRKFNVIMSQLRKLYPQMNDNYDYEFGIFVTIENKKRLRGCIGTFVLTNKLFECIVEMTLKSAFFDSRFFGNQINKNELKELSYKVNFISKPFTIYSIQQNYNHDLFNIVKSSLKVGLHGVTVYFENGNSATYLANVLIEAFGIKKLTMNKWNTVLQSLAEKAMSLGKKITTIELYECKEYDESIIYPSNLKIH